MKYFLTEKPGGGRCWGMVNSAARQGRRVPRPFCPPCIPSSGVSLHDCKAVGAASANTLSRGHPKLGEAVGENGLPSHAPFLEARKTSLSGDALFVSHQPELDPMTGTCCKGGWEGDSLVFPGSAVGGR